MIHIRRASRADSRAVGTIQLTSWSTMFPDAGIAANEYLAQFSLDEQAQDWDEILSAEDGANIVYVAENESQEIVGYISGRIDPEAPYASELVSVHILPAFRGSGTGHQLIAALADDLVQRGIASLWLWVLTGNRARRLYERLGGAPAGQHQIIIGKNDVMLEIDEVAYAWDNIDHLRARL